MITCKSSYTIHPILNKSIQIPLLKYPICKYPTAKIPYQQISHPPTPILEHCPRSLLIQSGYIPPAKTPTQGEKWKAKRAALSFSKVKVSPFIGRILRDSTHPGSNMKKWSAQRGIFDLVATPPPPSQKHTLHTKTHPYNTTPERTPQKESTFLNNYGVYVFFGNLKYVHKLAYILNKISSKFTDFLQFKAI